jgi:leucyl aminopeptidase
MDFEFRAASCAQWADLACDSMVLPIPASWQPKQLPAWVRSLVDSATSSGDFEAKAGSSFVFLSPPGCKAGRVVLVGAESGEPRALLAAAELAMSRLKGVKPGSLMLALSHLPALDGMHIRALVSAVSAATYQYRATKSKPSPVASFTRVALVGTASVSVANALSKALAESAGLAAGIAWARDWANRPGNVCTPNALAKAAVALSGKGSGLRVEVLERKAIEKLGMGAFLAVAQGSEQPPRFIVVRYDGAAGSVPPVLLVGKGITFDTGGISIKPAAEMDEMKFDMAGAAAVLGTMRALSIIKPAINVVALVPTCENMPDGRAVKPGDVVTSMSGQTIEVLNTDAEGRLILCDALTYAERFKPAAVVDVATLTGACVIALGHVNSGLFCADDALARELWEAGQSALDPCWRMPLDDAYAEGLKSSFADVANVGGRAGGAITAALFLKRFAGAYPWAHLDVAGTAWKSGAAKGATGRPVGLLTEFVLARAARSRAKSARSRAKSARRPLPSGSAAR